MSVVDKVIDALTPPETEEQRLEAHDKARSAASPGDWLSMVLDHHEQIYAAFDAVKHAGSPDEAITAQKRLMTLFTGHGTAEETVLYPSLAKDGQKGHATQAYTEQATAKMQFAELERLAPLSQEYMEKLGHIEGAVKHHIYEEESMWFLDMKENAPADLQQLATARFSEEYERYMNGAEQAGIGGLGSRNMPGAGGSAATATSGSSGSSSSDFGSDLGSRTGGGIESGAQGSLGGSMAGTGGTGSGLSPDYDRDTMGTGSIGGSSGMGSSSSSSATRSTTTGGSNASSVGSGSYDTAETGQGDIGPNGRPTTQQGGAGQLADKMARDEGVTGESGFGGQGSTGGTAQDKGSL